MILKNGLMSDIKNNLKNKSVYMYGAGKCANEMYERYSETFNSIVPRFFIDNDIKKQGTTVSFGKYEIGVISIEQFLNIVDDNSVVIFTLANYYEPLKNLNKIEQLSNVICYSYFFIKYYEKDAEEFKVLTDKNVFLSGAPKIPKIIHYCWFGTGEMNELNKKCIDSWNKYCPDYEIIRWDENNYDICKNKYMKKAYEDKKWAFVSDYARLDIINTYGGIYLDTDVEVIKCPDILLNEKAFCGFENMSYINLGLGCGTEPNNIVIKKMIELYNNLEWDSGSKTCPIYQTEILEEFGLVRNNTFQRLENITVFPKEFFCPMGIMSRQLFLTSNTFFIHHFAASWHDFSETDKEIRVLKENAIVN